MSKAFTREDDDSGSIVVPARAPLPPGTPNYVTARGLDLLRDELARLEVERAAIDAAPARDGSDGDARQRRLVLLKARLRALAERIGSALLINAPPSSEPLEVRFGTTVTVRAMATDERHHFTIVGVDEADAAAGRIAFTAPISRALLGRALGETVTMRAGRGDEELQIVAIDHHP